MKITTAIGRLTHGIVRSTTRFSRKPVLVAALAAIVAVSLFSISSATQILDVANLKVARIGHTATEMADGRVLIAGGQNETGMVSDSEIFDPATKSFSLGAKSLDGRTEHTATLLADGRVLVIGGRASDRLLDSTEIYDPAKNKFSNGPRLNHARAGHSATALADGRLLVAGGDAEGTAEIFSPETRQFALIEGRLGTARSLHSAALLRSGKVLLAGGLASSRSPLDSAELFDPETLSFSVAKRLMHIARTRPTLNVLPDGKVQVIGGDPESTMEMFNAEGEYFTAYAHLLGGTTPLSAILRAQTRAALIQARQRGAMQGPELPRAERVLLDQSLDRSGYTLTEMPQASLSLAAGGVGSDGVVQGTAVLFDSSASTVTTVKTDYAPGETVIITADGWQPGETVDMVLHREPLTQPDTTLSSVADENGNFTNSSYVVQDYDLNVTFTLTATGQPSSR